MIRQVYGVNPVDEVHLQEVMKEMLRRNEGPMVQAIDFDGYLVALEASHRMEAARRLGYPVCFLPIDRHSIVSENQFDDLCLRGREWVAKDLGLFMIKKRPKGYTPVYLWDDESGYLQVKFYPTCSLQTTYKIVGVTSLAWICLIGIGLLSLWR